MNITKNKDKKSHGLSERALNKTERLFAMVLLLQNKPFLSTKDLAEHFGVSRRTIFRDLRALSESGVPLTYADQGGYEILEGYQLPPLMLSAREAATLLVGTKFAELQPDASLKQDVDKVAMKIRSVLPKSVQDYIDRLAQSTILDPYWVNSVKVQLDAERDGLWYDLSESVAQQTSVLIDYYTPSRDTQTRRKIDPLGIVYYFDHWNLIGYCHLRTGIRNFRFDNIRNMFKLSERFERPDGFDLQKFLEEQGARQERRQLITLHLDASIYPWARRRVPAKIEEELPDKNGYRISFYFENLDYIANWLLSYGDKVFVVEPITLQFKLRKQAQALAKLYE